MNFIREPPPRLKHGGFVEDSEQEEFCALKPLLDEAVMLTQKTDEMAL
jgi:hypothetical protein